MAAGLSELGTVILIFVGARMSAKPFHVAHFCDAFRHVAARHELSSLGVLCVSISNSAPHALIPYVHKSSE
ncbi:hypothetical protein CC2G_006212 [Coprinopsis cinerea AmutBmut pab1-1]|nr:hypothetical protein CC2G_006212 [Coprinopsis cinerea AmutBmut pab1-1]